MIGKRCGASFARYADGPRVDLSFQDFESSSQTRSASAKLVLVAEDGCVALRRIDSSPAR